MPFQTIYCKANFFLNGATSCLAYSSKEIGMLLTGMDCALEPSFLVPEVDTLAAFEGAGLVS